jgi:glycosyltransferase involved in cell wall biosynthesis
VNIALVVLEDFPGSENRVQRQASALVRAGHAVTVYCATGPSSDLEFAGARIERAWTRRRKTYSVGQRLMEYTWFPLETFFWLVRDSFRFDVVQVANPPDWLVLAAIPWRWRTKGRVIFDVHDPMPELMADKGGRLRAAVLRRLEGLSARTADCVLSTSEGISRLLASRHGVESVLIPNAVDTLRFPLTDPDPSVLDSRPFRLSYHGTLAARFGVSTVVEATKLLLQQGVDVTLDVYGSGEGMDALVADAAPYDERMTFFGQVPSAELASRLRGVAVGLVPYHDSEFIRAVRSTKAFEYSAVGIPVVCSDVESLRSQMRDGALFANPGDARAFAEQIERLLGDPGLWAEVARRAQALLAQYDWERWSPLYVEAVTEAVVGPRPTDPLGPHD